MLMLLTPQHLYMIYRTQNNETNQKKKEKFRDDNMGDGESTVHEEYAQEINEGTALCSDNMEDESNNDNLHHTESQSFTVPVNESPCKRRRNDR